MSGLLLRFILNAGQVGFRNSSSKQVCGFEGHCHSRSVSGLGSIDHTICFLASSRIKFARSLLCGAHRDGLTPYAAFAKFGCAALFLKFSPVTIIFQAMRAILLASAIATSLGGLR
jgi:hypothetical protein